MCELCAMVGPDVAKEVNGFECAAPGGGPEGGSGGNHRDWRCAGQHVDILLDVRRRHVFR